MENFLTEPDAQLFGTEETPSESSPEKEVVKTEEATSQAEDKVEEVPNDLDDRPLHKDSRFKEVIVQRNSYRDKYEALLEQANAKETTKETSSNATSTKPEWFKKVFGDDEEVWSGFQSMTSKAKDEAKKEALQEIEAKQTEAQDTQKRANDWVEEQVSSLKETAGDFDRNALFKVMEKYKPTDDEGNLDFKAGLEILKLQQPAVKEKSTARRQLADKLNTTSGKTESSARDYKTSADLRKMGGWDSVYEN